MAPDLGKLPFEWDNGVKVFRLVAEPLKQEVLPGKVFDLWGYNGSAPGPTIEVVEGDRVRILFENRLPEATTVHWHGLEVPIEMDGVPAISQPEVEPGGRFTYEFTLRQHGTFFYHSHGAMQEMIGLLGLFIIHPRTPYRPAVQKDFAIVLQEYAVLPNNTIPNTLSMEFNWLTFNGKAAPATTPMLVKLGERVRLRIVNIGMDHHPIHLHGMQFAVTGTEGGRIPEALWYPQNTVLVGVAQARVVEFDAVYPGDWMLHCHLPHHMMNQMVSMVGPMAHAGHGMRTGGGHGGGHGDDPPGQRPLRGPRARSSAAGWAWPRRSGASRTPCVRRRCRMAAAGTPGMGSAGRRRRPDTRPRLPPGHVHAHGRRGGEARDVRARQELDGRHAGDDDLGARPAARPLRGHHATSGGGEDRSAEAQASGPAGAGAPALSRPGAVSAIAMTVLLLAAWPVAQVARGDGPKDARPQGS